MKPNVLLIEEDDGFAHTLTTTLIREGYGIRWVRHVIAGLNEEVYNTIFIDETDQRKIKDLQILWPNANIVSTAPDAVTDVKQKTFALPRPFPPEKLLVMLEALSRENENRQ